MWGASAFASNPPLIEWSDVKVDFPVNGPAKESLVVTFVRSSRPESETISKITFEMAGRRYEVEDERLLVMRLRNIPISFVELLADNANDFSLTLHCEHVDEASDRHPERYLEIVVYGWRRHEVMMHEAPQGHPWGRPAQGSPRPRTGNVLSAASTGQGPAVVAVRGAPASRSAFQEKPRKVCLSASARFVRSPRTQSPSGDNRHRALRARSSRQLPSELPLRHPMQHAAEPGQGEGRQCERDRVPHGPEVRVRRHADAGDRERGADPS